jgi:hypothetical protein
MMSDPPSRVRAPFFKTVLEQIGETPRPVVLELGAARQDLLALLHGSGCRLIVANLAATFADSGEANDSSGIAPINDVLRDLCQQEPVDIVFAWDFLNFLDFEALALFMGNLAMLCRPRASVHALIVYAERLMPQRPGLLEPVDAAHLRVHTGVELDRIAPRYSPDDLRRCTPAYDVAGVRLLGNGMQEYLFKLRQ